MIAINMMIDVATAGSAIGHSNAPIMHSNGCASGVGTLPLIPALYCIVLCFCRAVNTYYLVPNTCAVLYVLCVCRAFSTHYLYNSSLASAGNTTGNATASAANTAPNAQLNSTDQMAQSTYEFVTKNMLDSSNTLWFWNVSGNGSTPIQRNKVIDGQMSVLLALR